jgi:adenine-specific DNA-methyltransferase
MYTNKTINLFGDDYKVHRMPKTQYLGSKERLVDWIFENSPKNINCVFDAFSGTSVVGYYFKKQGKKVISNDFLKFNYHIARALTVNKSETLTEGDLKLLFAKNSKPDTLVTDIFTDVFFEKTEALFLDNFRANLDSLPNDYKKSLAFTVINRALTRKILLGHFAHTSALRYSRDPKRISRNPSIAKPIKQLFVDLVEDYNNAVFDNGQHNLAYCEDTIQIVQALKVVDLAYFDPPYCGLHPDYQAFYHFLETYVEYWRDKKFVNGTKAYFPKKVSGFVQKSEIVSSFNKLFKNSSHIPYWLISYNSKSYPNKTIMLELIEKYKKVQVFEYEYQNHYGGKGSKKGTREYLFYCYNN